MNHLAKCMYSCLYSSYGWYIYTQYTSIYTKNIIGRTIIHKHHTRIQARAKSKEQRCLWPTFYVRGNWIIDGNCDGLPLLSSPLLLGDEFISPRHRQKYSRRPSYTKHNRTWMRPNQNIEKECKNKYAC